MKAFYDAFYTAIAHSQAHATFCTRVLGRDLGQHGFADVAQLDLLAQVTRLDLGITRWIWDAGTVRSQRILRSELAPTSPGWTTARRQFGRRRSEQVIANASSPLWLTISIG